MKYATSPDALPPGEHFVILVFRIVYCDTTCQWADSHTTFQSTDCLVYPDKVEWETEIKRRLTSQQQEYDHWVPLIVKRPAISTTVKVDISG